MGAAVEFKKSLGLTTAITIIVGSMIGSGILRLPGSMLAEVPSPWLVVIAWFIGAIVTVIGALVFAELAAMFPRAGGQYVFLREGLSPIWSYMYGWGMFWIIMTGIIAAVAVVFADFLNIFIELPGSDTQLVDLGIAGEITLPAWGEAFVAIGLIGFLSIVNYFGVKYGGLVQNLTTFAKAIGLLALVAIVFLAGERHPQAFETVTEEMPSGFALFVAVGAAMSLSLFAYDGWPQATYVAAEMKNAKRNLPLALIVGPLVTAFIYIVVTFTTFYAVPAEQGRTATRIVTDAARAAMGSGGATFIGMVALVSTFGTVNAYVLTSPRIFYAMAKDGVLFPQMARLSPNGTPGYASLLTFLWASLLALSGLYEATVFTVVFGLWLFYIPTAIAHMRLRRVKANAARPFRTPLYPLLPVAFLLTALFVCFFILFNEESRFQALFALVILAVGAVVYYFQIVRPGVAVTPAAQTRVKQRTASSGGSE